MLTLRPHPRRSVRPVPPAVPQRRLARRIADGLAPERAAEIERIGPDELAAMLGEAHFAELVAAYREQLALDPEERLRRLAKRALFVLEDEIEVLGSGPAAAWLLYELGNDRNPAMTLARAIARVCDAAAPARPASATAAERPLRQPAKPPGSEQLVRRRMNAVGRRLAGRLLAEIARTALPLPASAVVVARAVSTESVSADAGLSTVAAVSTLSRASAGRAPAAPASLAGEARPLPRRPAEARMPVPRLAASLAGGTSLGTAMGSFMWSGPPAGRPASTRQGRPAGRSGSTQKARLQGHPTNRHHDRLGTRPVGSFSRPLPAAPVPA